MAAGLAGSWSRGLVTGKAEGAVQAEGRLRHRGALGRYLHSPSKAEGSAVPLDPPFLSGLWPGASLQRLIYAAMKAARSFGV